MSPLTVRAVDVGYGHIKLTTGRDPESGLIQTDSFPSKSPVLLKSAVTHKVVTTRDAAIIPIGDALFEVGKEVSQAMSADYAGDVLDTDFPLSAAYAARLYGALNYMYKGLPHHTIDYLVLGLPLSTIRQHADKLADLFVGEKTINAQGHTVQIKHVEVFPQPLGSYMAYLATAPVVPGKKMPMALVIDPGYNTVDWYVIRGTTPTDVKSGALNRGMGALLTAKAEAMLAPVAQHGCAEVQGGTVAELVRHLDARMSSGEPFTMFNRVIDIDRYKKVGLTIIEEAVQAVKNSIGLGGEIDVIIMTGGGAQTYADAVRRKFPQHYIEILAEPAFANARGFHFLGERLARSAERAMANTVPA